MTDCNIQMHVQTIQEKLKNVNNNIYDFEAEHNRAESTLATITKIHEKIRADDKVTQTNKTKLKSLYATAVVEAINADDQIRKGLEKIYEIRAIRNERRIQAKQAGNKETIRRGQLMKMLQVTASMLPLWIGRVGEKSPPLCGCIPADFNHVAKPGEMVAALSKGIDDDENWILAEVIQYNSSTGKYEVDDIDEEQKERLILSRRRIIPLPLMRACPETHKEALYEKNTIVNALYPQTTCFYKAIVNFPPKFYNDEYEVLFEDSSYPEGYSPPLKVAQRYVIPYVRDKKK